MASKTNSRRRSKRIKNKQQSSSQSEDEDIDINDKNDNNENESGSSSDNNIRNRLRDRPTTNLQEQDMVGLEGDINTKWNDGDVVWAKYRDYPWWPGQIEINTHKTKKRRTTRKSSKTTICVKWFGDYPTPTYVQ